MMYTIYLIEDHRNKPYVGVTSKTPEKRLKRHKAAAKYGIDSHLYAAMRKYGCSNFDIIPLDTENSKEGAFELEKEWISKLGTYEDWGYNCTTGGDSGPKLTGEDNPFYGRSHSNSTKKKMSKARKGTKNASKISKKEAKEIKWLANESNMYQKEIGDKYGVSPSAVSDIKNETSWSDVEEKEPSKWSSVKSNVKWEYLNTDKTQQEVADKYGFSQRYVGKMKMDDSVTPINPNK